MKNILAFMGALILAGHTCNFAMDIRKQLKPAITHKLMARTFVSKDKNSHSSYEAEYPCCRGDFCFNVQRYQHADLGKKLENAARTVHKDLLTITHRKSQEPINVSMAITIKKSAESPHLLVERIINSPSKDLRLILAPLVYTTAQILEILVREYSDNEDEDKQIIVLNENISCMDFNLAFCYEPQAAELVSDEQLRLPQTQLFSGANASNAINKRVLPPISTSKR